MTDNATLVRDLEERGVTPHDLEDTVLALMQDKNAQALADADEVEQELGLVSGSMPGEPGGSIRPPAGQAPRDWRSRESLRGVEFEVLHSFEPETPASPGAEGRLRDATRPTRRTEGL